MFQEPDEVAAEQSAAKLDLIAAARRSSIRRESTVRPGRSNASRRAAIERIREEVEERRRRRREAAEEANNFTSPSQSQLEMLRQAPNPQPEPERMNSIRLRQRVHLMELHRMAMGLANTETQRRGDMDVPSLRRPDVEPDGELRIDPVTFDVVEILNAEDEEAARQLLPRPLRESGLRFEMGATSQSESEPSRPPRFSHARLARVPSPSGSRRPPWSFSVHRPSIDLEDEETENEYRATPQPLGLDRSPGGPATSTPPPESLYPALRRVNHISPRPLGESRPRVDGLGDRLRSPSPMSDGPVEENWGTLLDTLTTGPSSTATSFLSSRSNSRSGSNQSSQATTTTTSFGEIGGDDSCDLDLPTGITEEDARMIRARHGRLRRDASARPRRSDMWNTLTSELSNQSDPPRINERVVELEMLGTILDRMQSRQEIPEELWAAVGLSPDIVRGTPFDLVR
ncbi:hypothetical protein AYL99_05781 [Fonsecaea erecta]|uniref:Uncharacterized protein n=1 Tax=Fonsecaea erecta TaxID=1367422 RepID=A0A178ZLU6_9EURO|nr:hypothetical protein AYL99_05781 [Fonsecaea erecta]OAP60779.1 hypothetical protein AYL99_05781 [Fonsecaea erecta]